MSSTKASMRPNGNSTSSEGGSKTKHIVQNVAKAQQSFSAFLKSNIPAVSSSANNNIVPHTMSLKPIPTTTPTPTSSSNVRLPQLLLNSFCHSYDNSPYWQPPSTRHQAVQTPISSFAKPASLPARPPAPQSFMPPTSKLLETARYSYDNSPYFAPPKTVIPEPSSNTNMQQTRSRIPPWFKSDTGMPPYWHPENCPCLHSGDNKRVENGTSTCHKHAHNISGVNATATSDTEVAEEDQDISMDLENSDSDSDVETLKSSSTATNTVKADITKDKHPIRAKEEQTKLKRKARLTLAEAFPDAVQAKGKPSKSEAKAEQIDSGSDRVDW